MVPDKFDMVDMGGIDLIESQGLAVDGLYQRLVESITLCRYQCLYNWKFDGILIPPSYVEMEVHEDGVWINEGVMVDENDVIYISTTVPPVPVKPVVEQLSVIQNGTYTVPTGVDGYNPVVVNVSAEEPVIESLSVTQNGTYTVPTGVDGYNPVVVTVPTEEPSLQTLTVTENGLYLPGSGFDGFSRVEVVVPSGALSPILYWDFTKSLTDEIAGILATLAGGATQSSEGVLLAGAGSIVSLGNVIQPSGRSIEIEIGDCEAGISGTNHARFIMTSTEEGLIYRNNSVWSFYSGTSWATNSNISDPDFFSNSTMKIEIDINGYWKIYKDDILVYSPSKPLSTGNIAIGAKTTSFYQVYIKTVKVY